MKNAYDLAVEKQEREAKANMVVKATERIRDSLAHIYVSQLWIGNAHARQKARNEYIVACEAWLDAQAQLTEALKP